MESRISKTKVMSEDEVQFYEESMTPLSDRDRDLLLALLDAPPAANQALKRAAARSYIEKGLADSTRPE